MLRAFLGFPVDLPTIPEPFEQLRNAARRNLMAHLTQRRRELGVALGYPQQWSHRVADCRRLQKLSQVLKQRRVLLDQCSSAASRAPHPVRRSRKIEFLQPSPNRASSDPRRPRNRADPADARRPRLRRCKKASSPLIEPDAESLVTDANCAFVYHPPRIRIILRPGNPLADSIISRRRLSGSSCASSPAGAPPKALNPRPSPRAYSTAITSSWRSSRSSITCGSGGIAPGAPGTTPWRSWGAVISTSRTRSIAEKSSPR